MVRLGAAGRRVLLTGGTGFVGGTVAAVLTDHGADVRCAVRRDPGSDFPWPWCLVDLGIEAHIAAALAEHASTDILHLAIDNDLAGLYRDRRAGFDAYVGMTGRIVRAANRHGAQVGYLSTDWVFDGSGHLVDESEPVNPLNLYGLFKALSERTVLDGADRGFVARVGGVQGRHLTKPNAPRRQDCGFGYFVLSLVDALSAGRPFTVWQDPQINNVASPITAAEIAARLLIAIDQQADGVLHLVGADAVSRVELAEHACRVFDLDPALVRTGPVPDGAMLPARMPVDTSLATSRTDELLGTPSHGIVAQLSALRDELRTGQPQPLTVRSHSNRIRTPAGAKEIHE